MAVRTTAWRQFAAPLLMLALPACDEVRAGHKKPPPLAAQEATRCYDQTKPAIFDQADHHLSREVLVIVDQTTIFPDDVRLSAVNQAAALAAPGSRLSVGIFSSYTQNALSMITYESYIEQNFPAARRDDAPMHALRKLDECLGERREKETTRLRNVLDAAIASGRPTMQNSDVLTNIKNFSARLAESKADDKILIVLSDMLENSSTMSFYTKGEMRAIDPNAELATVDRAGLFAKLPKTRVFVIGTGLIPPDVTKYRPGEQLRPLERFWTEYFQRSGVVSIEMGEPILLKPID